MQTIFILSHYIEGQYFLGIWFRRLVNCKKYVREVHMQSKKGSSNMTFNAAKYFCINLSVHVQYREIEHLFWLSCHVRKHSKFWNSSALNEAGNIELEAWYFLMIYGTIYMPYMVKYYNIPLHDFSVYTNIDIKLGFPQRMICICSSHSPRN